MKNVDENKGKKIGYTRRRLRLGEGVEQFFLKLVCLEVLRERRVEGKREK